MTYKLNPIVEKIQSPIILRFEDPEIPERRYTSGMELACAEFDKKYLIRTLTAQSSTVIITVTENGAIGPANWVGEEMVSFF